MYWVCLTECRTFQGGNSPWTKEAQIQSHSVFVLKPRLSSSVYAPFYVEMLILRSRYRDQEKEAIFILFSVKGKTSILKIHMLNFLLLFDYRGFQNNSFSN